MIAASMLTLVCAFSSAFGLEPGKDSFAGPEAASVTNPLNGETHQYTVKHVMEAWEQRQFVSSIKLTWQLDKSGAAALTRHHNNWATDKEDRPRELEIRGSQVQFEFDEFETVPFDTAQQRLLDRLKKLDAGPPIADLKSSQQRFYEAADARFPTSDGEYRDPFRLTSVIDQASRTTYWEPQGKDMARALVTKLPAYGEAASIFGHLHLDGLDSLDALDVMPLLLLFRPLAPNVCGIYPQNCMIDSKMMSIDGHNCVVIREQLNKDKTHLRRSFWCDPQRGFLILQYIGEGEGNEETQLHISYVERSGLGWVPSAWTAICTHKNAFVIDRYVCGVASGVKLLQSQAAREVPLSLPPGTWLIDEPMEKEFLVRTSTNQEAIDLADPTKIRGQLSELQAEATRLHESWQSWNGSSGTVMNRLKYGLPPILLLGLAASSFAFRKRFKRTFSRKKKKRLVGR